jgi:hypothetical protein
MTVDKNRLLTITREFGQFKATTSYFFDKDTHEVKGVSDVYADYLGKSGTQIERDVGEMTKWFSRCIQGRELK